MTKSRTFVGSILADYHLFPAAVPHYYTCFDRVGELLLSNFAGEHEDVLHLLEIGPGPAIGTARLLDVLGPRWHYTGVDIDPNELQKAAVRLRGKPNIRLVVGNGIEYLESSDIKYHAVFSAWTIHNMRADRRPRLYKACWTGLMPGGLFVNIDKYISDSRERNIADLRWQIGKFLTIYSQLGRLDIAIDWTDHYLEDQLAPIAMYEGDELHLMQDSGFTLCRDPERYGLELVVMAAKQPTK